MLGRTYAFMTATRVRSYSRNSARMSDAKVTGSAGERSRTSSASLRSWAELA